jgi:hypothetical protein
MATWRDKLAGWLCNLILHTVATKTYRAAIGGAIAYGMSAAARDAREGRAVPEHWSRYISVLGENEGG